MAFTVGSEANSYVSVEYADSYFADRNVVEWAGELAAKEGALVRATDYVRAMFSHRFDPALVDPLDPPETLKRAVCEYALIELVSPFGLAPHSSAAAETVVIKEKVGPIETAYAVVAPSPAGRRRAFPVADALIARLILPSLGLNRVTR